MLHSKFFRSRWNAIAWLIFISFLFFLPGSAIPKESWFSKIFIDKWVHLFLFAVLIFLWMSAFKRNHPGYTIMVLAVAVGYGIMVEVIQELWIPNRSFDVYDIFADAAGCMLGIMIWRWGQKNKPL